MLPQQGQVDVSRDDKTVVAADRAVELPPVATDPRSRFSVVEPGHHLYQEFRLSVHALHDAKELAMRILPPASAHGKAVNKTELAVIGPKGCLQHECALYVPPGDDVTRACGSDRAIAALFPVEQPAKTAIRVEPRHATPVDGTAARHEGS